jgi:flagellar hook-associated protein 3 FlgL
MSQINSDQVAIQNLQVQLSTGRRIQTPSEDLAATVKILSAQRQHAFRLQSETNLRNADGILSASESSLSQAQRIMNEMKSITLEAAGNTLTDSQRQSLKQQVDEAIRTLTDLANSKFADQFIFAGSSVRQPPLRPVDDVVRFIANQDDLNTVSDYTATLAANVSADDAFGVLSKSLVGTIDLNPSIAADTPLSQLNEGLGVRLGIIRINDGTDTVEINLTGSYTLGDIIDKIGSSRLGNRRLDASLSADGINIDFADGDGGFLMIDDVSTGRAARDLGINNAGPPQASPVIGSDLKPILTPTTRLSQLLGGAGLPPDASFIITQSGTDFVISLDGLETVGDLLNRMEQSGARLRASIDPSGKYLSIKNTESGSSLSIGENGGVLATQLGIRSLGLTTPLSALNSGAGIGINQQGNDLVFTRNDGSRLEVSLSGANTIGDVINLINDHADNQVTETRIAASLESIGNGIRLTSQSGTQPISITNAVGSDAARGLGLVATGQVSGQGSPQDGQQVIRGRNVNDLQVEGIFSTLIQLSRAIQEGRPEALQGISKQLEQDLERMTTARGLVGTRQQAISLRIERSVEARIQLKQIESENLDADLATVISELTQRQAALQASLQMMGQTSRMSLFDYL